MKVKITGFKELDKALAEFKPVTAKAIAKRALLKSAQPVVEDAKARVPVRLGRLRDSITASARLAVKAGNAEFAAVMRSGGTKDEALAALRDARRGAAGGSLTTVHVGAGQLPHAHLQEFGTDRHPPQPYLRPAWDANRDKVLASIAGDLREEIDKAAKRAAAKALKAKR